MEVYGLSNIVSDIVDEYRNNIREGIDEVYYKKDLVEGLKLIVTFIGIGKIVLCIGGIAAASIGSILSFAANHPQAAARCAQVIYNNSDKIGELITSAGERINEAYNSLSEKQKKYVRTVTLLIAKNGLHWDSLH
jgi:hypothetical protein